MLANNFSSAKLTMFARPPVWLTLLFCLMSNVAQADFPAKGTIYLQAKNGKELAIGTVDFNTTDTGSTGIKVEIDNDAFTEHFLSMRPFRCIESSAEWFCYLIYPYSLRNTVTPDDLSDLEYNLLFIKKSPKEFGIDAWNGLYYRLSLQEDGTINGALFEGDLNVLQSPPENEYDKPVDLEEFIPASVDKRLFPSLQIRPDR